MLRSVKAQIATLELLNYFQSYGESLIIKCLYLSQDMKFGAFLLKVEIFTKTIEFFNFIWCMVGTT